MARSLHNILVTGGAGFIGSNFIHYLFEKTDFTGRIVNYDALTYAGNLENLADIEKKFGGSRYFFIKGDITDRPYVEHVFRDYAIDTVVNFAAESHVDRSILGPETFIKTNVFGTYTLLDVAHHAWDKREDTLFHHVSTDEVFGSLGNEGYFREDTAYDPHSPYSATKAASDHLVMAYHYTYGLPTTLSNCSNNYGPYQFPEKLIPLMILNMKEGKSLPVYGDGKNVRDWLYVEDHVAALWLILQKGKSGEKYNIGGENEWENIHLIRRLISFVAEETSVDPKELESLVVFVRDRPGHDRRYAIDCSKIKKELGWKQKSTFDEGLRQTVHWYLTNDEWCARVKSGEYQKWIEKNYVRRI